MASPYLEKLKDMKMNVKNSLIMILSMCVSFWQYCWWSYNSTCRYL